MDKFKGTEMFFKSLDSYLMENLKKLSCNDIYNIYSNFGSEMQKIKGNANGFTGISEVIIFRYLFALCGGIFSAQAVENSETLQEFNNGTYTLGQSSRIKLDDKRKYPDIIIKKDKTVAAIIQIKTYVTNGIKEAKHEIEDFKLFKKYYKEMKGYMIIFIDYGEQSDIRKIFEEFGKVNKWFKLVILQNNENNFYNEIKEIV